MAVDIQSYDGKIIRQFVPLALLSMEKFEKLCGQIIVEEVKKNTFIFERGDMTVDLIYLIKGTVSLRFDELEVEIVKAGSDSANFALAHQLPRKISAYTQTNVHFLRLDPQLINGLSSHTTPIKKEETINMTTDEAENDDDWMTTLLGSPLFRALPPANLQQIIINLEPIVVEKGDFIIKQGDEADYYYLIEKGLCLVSYKSPDGNEVNVAQLKPQDTFGEDSIISGKPRNVSIIAMTKVALFRLAKEHFIPLIQEPALNFIEHSDVAEQLDKGAILIDVRDVNDYKAHHLARSINTPFLKLRNQIKFFDEEKHIILVCQDEYVSSAAAFLLLRHDFPALIVKGGMNNEPNKEVKQVEEEPPKLEPVVVTDKEEPEQSKTVEQPALLSTEQIIVMQAENSALKEKLNMLKAEKEALEKNYRALYKHAEKLKAIVDNKK